MNTGGVFKYNHKFEKKYSDSFNTAGRCLVEIISRLGISVKFHLKFGTGSELHQKGNYSNKTIHVLRHYGFFFTIFLFEKAKTMHVP